jgi:putative sigma-54 modulation protein
MRVVVRGQSLEVSEVLHDHVEHRLRFALRPFSGQISRVVVRLRDLNGPRGGVDKLCRIEVHLAGAGKVIADGLHAGLYAAVDLAADRVRRSIVRALERRHDWQPSCRGRA